VSVALRVPTISSHKSSGAALSALTFDSSGRVANSRRVAGVIRQQLGDGSTSKVGTLLAQRLTPDLSGEATKKILSLLPLFPCECENELVRYFRIEPDSSLRTLLIDVAAAQPHQRSFDLLALLVTDDDAPTIRHGALARLVELHRVTSFVRLTGLIDNALNADTDPTVIQAAMQTLEPLDTPKALAHASRQLASGPAVTVRSAAADLIARRGSPEQIDELASAFLRGGLPGQSYKMGLTIFVRRFSLERVSTKVAKLTPEQLGKCDQAIVFVGSPLTKFALLPGDPEESDPLLPGAELNCIAKVGDYVQLRNGELTGWVKRQNVTLSDSRTFFRSTSGGSLVGYLATCQHIAAALPNLSSMEM
jgi:hypothetical protein